MSSAVSWSLEFFPPRNNDTCDNVLRKVAALNDHIKPKFCTITWKAGGASRHITLDIAARMQNELQIDTIIHVAAVGMTQQDMLAFLEECETKSIRNVLALRGDRLPGCITDFTEARQLVKFIRDHYESRFNIGVAAHPECHPEYKPDKASNLAYLKTKVNAGADFLITQMFFDAQVFIDFVDDCRAIGIMCPIYPGILVFSSYRSLQRMMDICGVCVPSDLLEFMETHQNEPNVVATYAIQFTKKLCQDLIQRGVKHIHLYTMNDLENTIQLYDLITCR